MGRTHAEAVRRLPNAELKAIAGGSRAPALAARYQVALEPTKESLFARPDIDAVVLTTPHHLLSRRRWRRWLRESTCWSRSRWRPRWRIVTA